MHKAEDRENFRKCQSGTSLPEVDCSEQEKYHWWSENSLWDSRLWENPETPEDLFSLCMGLWIFWRIFGYLRRWRNARCSFDLGEFLMHLFPFLRFFSAYSLFQAERRLLHCLKRKYAWVLGCNKNKERKEWKGRGKAREAEAKGKGTNCKTQSSALEAFHENNPGNDLHPPE